MQTNVIYNEDCLQGIKKLDNKSIDVVLTSPPYNVIRANSLDRGYDEYKDGMSNEEYINFTLNLFNEFDRVLKPNGTIIYNMCYGSENNECMFLTIAAILQQTNFTLGDVITWKKKSAIPNNVSPNKLTRICEYVYIFVRKEEYLTYTANKKVVSVSTTGQKIYENVYNFIEAKNSDFATELNKATYSSEFVIKLLDMYSANEGDVVLDPFMGTGTTAIGCIATNRQYIGFELSKAQCEFAEDRIRNNNDIKIINAKKENTTFANIFDFME